MKLNATCSFALTFLLGLPAMGWAQANGCLDQVPDLTGDTAAVSTSGIFSSTYDAWKAFDAEVTGQSMWISEVFETPAWIAYDFGTPTVVEKYQIVNSNGSSLTSRAPKDFTFQGWDGESWAVLDTRLDETGWTSGHPRTYRVASPGIYLAYRLHITDDNDPREGVVVISMSDLQFIACAPEIFSDDFESGNLFAWSE